MLKKNDEFRNRGEGYKCNKLLPSANRIRKFTEYQIEEIIKCSNDVCYFAEKYFTIVSLDKGKIKIPLLPHQRTLLDLIENNRKVICQWSRQTYKTTTLTVYALHYILFNKDKIVAIVGNKVSTAKMILARIKLAFEQIQNDFIKCGVEEWNKTSVKFDNGCRIFVGATSSGSIRGDAVNILIVDETAFIGKNLWDDFYRSVVPTISSGEDSKIILSSSLNSLNGGLNHFTELFSKAKLGKNSYVPFEVDWRVIPSRNEKWKQEMINDTSPEDFAQEHENLFVGSSNSLFKAYSLSGFVAETPISIENDTFKIYKNPIENHVYIMTIDSARGYGLDYSVINVTDISTENFEQVAVFADNEISPSVFPHIIKKIGLLYNSAYALIENNDIGLMVVSDLNYELDYENIINPANNKKYELGIRTTHITKNVGCRTLKTLIEKKKYVVVDKETIKQMYSFVSTGSSYAASTDSHDDIVMCLVLFAWLTTTDVFQDLYKLGNIKEILYKEEVDSFDSIMPFGFIEDGINDYEKFKMVM